MTSWILELLSFGLDLTLWELWSWLWVRNQARPRKAANKQVGWSANWSKFSVLFTVKASGYCWKGWCITLHPVMHLIISQPHNAFASCRLRLYMNICYNSRALYSPVAIIIFIQMTGYVTYSEDCNRKCRDISEMKLRHQLQQCLTYFFVQRTYTFLLVFLNFTLFCFALKKSTFYMHDD